MFVIFLHRFLLPATTATNWKLLISNIQRSWSVMCVCGLGLNLVGTSMFAHFSCSTPYSYSISWWAQKERMECHVCKYARSYLCFIFGCHTKSACSTRKLISNSPLLLTHPRMFMLRISHTFGNGHRAFTRNILHPKSRHCRWKKDPFESEILTVLILYKLSRYLSFSLENWNRCVCVPAWGLFWK